MKPISIFIFALCATAQITAANAATKCVKLAYGYSSCTNTTGSFDTALASYHADWKANCTTQSTVVGVEGIAFCSDTSGSLNGTATSLSLSSTLNNNKYCWCKMVSPAVSRWVLATMPASGTVCAQTCVNACGSAAANTAAFRQALFANMSD